MYSGLMPIAIWMQSYGNRGICGMVGNSNSCSFRSLYIEQVVLKDMYDIRVGYRRDFNDISTT